MTRFARAEIESTLGVLQEMARDEALLAAVEQAAALAADAIRQGRKLMFAGNGGSAADAQHLAAELVGKLGRERPALPAIALTTDTSILTAVANDYGYEDVFLRQLQALGQAGDLLIGISTSGRSRNLVKAFAEARARGIRTVALTGRSGGDLKALSEVCLCVPSTDTQKIQEAHIVLGHILCGSIERALYPPQS